MSVNKLKVLILQENEFYYFHKLTALVVIADYINK